MRGEGVRAKGEDKKVGHDRKKQTKKEIMPFRCFQGVHIHVRVKEMLESFLSSILGLLLIPFRK